MRHSFYPLKIQILFQRGRLKSYKFVPEGMYSGILAKPLFRNVETQRKLRLIQSNFIYLGLILILKRCPSRNIYIAMYVHKKISLYIGRVGKPIKINFFLNYCWVTHRKFFNLNLLTSFCLCWQILTELCTLIWN